MGLPDYSFLRPALATRLFALGLLALGALALAIGAVGLLDPFYRLIANPERWIDAALLPNPVTAVGAALQEDVLRFSWTYEHLHANEYLYRYPPAWQTAGLYLTLA